MRNPTGLALSNHSNQHGAIRNNHVACRIDRFRCDSTPWVHLINVSFTCNYSQFSMNGMCRSANTLVDSCEMEWYRSNLRHIPQPHHLPARRYRAQARHVAPLAVPAGDAASEQLVEEGVSQALRGGDDGLGALNGPSMASSTAAMARCSARGGRRIWREDNL